MTTDSPALDRALAEMERIGRDCQRRLRSISRSNAELRANLWLMKPFERDHYCTDLGRGLRFGWPVDMSAKPVRISDEKALEWATNGLRIAVQWFRRGDPRGRAALERARWRFRAEVFYHAGLARQSLETIAAE